MRTAFPAFALVLTILAAGAATTATAADRGSSPGKSPSQLACERACHDDHRGWIDLCIEYHDPREILPSARGQCVEAGAERLRACLAACR